MDQIQETKGHDMEQRFVVFDEGSEPRIYKAPLNQIARLINEFPNKEPAVYENLKDAKEAALAIISRAEANASAKFGRFSTRPAPQNEDLRKTNSELTADRVQTY